MKLLDVVRATLRTTFRPRFELRVPRFFFDLRFVAAKVAADYADLHRRKQDRTGDCADIAGWSQAQALRLPMFGNSERLALQLPGTQRYARPM